MWFGRWLPPLPKLLEYVIKGLAEIDKVQQTTQATQQSEAATLLQQLPNIVHYLSQVIKTTQIKATPPQTPSYLA